jgi:hypothetical protein
MEKIKAAIEKARQQQLVTGSRQPVQKTAELDAINSSDVVEVNYKKTRVVHIEPSHLKQHRIISFEKADPLSLSFDILRTQILSRMEEHGWRTLAITSPVPECGKSVVAINLALSIAQHTSKTAMLVDFDLRRPRVANYLGIDIDKSLNDVLEGLTAVSDALVNPDLPRLVILPTARPFKRPSETLSSNKTKALIEDIRERYQDRIVIFDLPPLLSADDVMTVLPNIDCVLVVVGNGMVKTSEINESLRYLQGANLVGVVLNKAEIETKKYYY